MALDSLLTALRRHAETERDALLAGARVEAERVAAEAAERTASARATALAREEARLRAAHEVEAAKAQRVARRAVLEARQRFLDRVFAAATALLPEAAASDAYRAALPQHLARVLACVGEEAVEIHCSEAIAATVRTLVADRAQVTVRAAPDARPGIRIVTADGAIEVDDTLDGGLDRQRPRLSLSILSALEGAA